MDSGDFTDTARFPLNRILTTRIILLLLPWIVMLWQFILADTATDFYCAAIAGAGSFLIFYYSFTPRCLLYYPLSTLVLLGFCVTLLLGPSLFTALEGKSLTYNLQVPIQTFSHAFASSLVAILAHIVYRKSVLSGNVRQFAQRFLWTLGVFKPLSLREASIFSLVGVFSLGITSWFSGLTDSTPIVKFIQGFQFMAIMPVALFLNPLTQSYRVEQASVNQRRIRIIILSLSLAFIVIISTGRNARGPIIVPIACLFIGTFFAWLYNLFRIRSSQLIVFSLAALLCMPPLVDLATSVVMVRSMRTEISPYELAIKTLEQFNDKSSLLKYRETILTEAAEGWDEFYLDNIFLARFANAKYPDNSLLNSSQISVSSSYLMADFQWLRLFVQLPQPVLQAFGISPSVKNAVISRSIGDQLYFQATGNPSALGGFRTGHFFGSGMAGFGYTYILILFTGFLFLFPLFDSHALVTMHSIVNSAPVISALAISQLLTWFAISNSESVIQIIGFPLRGFIEPVLLFSLSRWILRKLRLD